MFLFFFLFVPHRSLGRSSPNLEGRWRAAPDISLRGSFFERSRSLRSKVKFMGFLAHLSRRLIGELIVYPCSGVRPSSVRRPSVRRPSSTISKIFFSETAGTIVLILHIHHLQVGGKNNCVFCFDRIRTLVAMATYASHRLIMEKSENCQFLLSCWRYLNFVFAEMFIE